jgi:hypothetical protein
MRFGGRQHVHTMDIVQKDVVVANKHRQYLGVPKWESTRSAARGWGDLCVKSRTKVNRLLVKKGGANL